MKKAEQAIINQKVVDEYNKVMGEWNDVKFLTHVSRLRTCQAQVYRTPTHLILLSYRTVVCAINLITGDTYDFLRYAYGYTATSAQHIAKFIRDYGSMSGKLYRYAD